MAEEYWFVQGELIAHSNALREPIHYCISKVFVCGLCGESWARRLIDDGKHRTIWAADDTTECPSCPPFKRTGRLKLITYQESELLEYETVPSAILALEFLWLYLSEKTND